MRPETSASEPFEYRPWWPGSQIDLLASTESAMQLGKSAKNTRVPLTCKKTVFSSEIREMKTLTELNQQVLLIGGSNRAVPNRLSLITSNVVDSGLLVQVEFG